MAGLRAMVGIVIAFGVLVVFLLPALRDGAPAVPVALVASAAILFAVIYLAHGVSLRTSAALLGTLTSLLVAALLSWAAIEFAHLTGLSEDQNNEVAAYLGNVSITGLLLAGFIIGSLGVLNDVTITQASAVFELAELEPAGRRAIFVGAMRVGRDHIASTVYTLVLAYAGSALPLLLLFSVANRPLGDVLTSECGHRDRPVSGRWYRFGVVGAADHRHRGGARDAAARGGLNERFTHGAPGNRAR